MKHLGDILKINGAEIAPVDIITFDSPCQDLSVAGKQAGLDFLTIRLPSGRKLYYANPALGVNHWGNPSIMYKGMDQTTKKWKQIETYGGKLVENVVQAIARDCLAEAIERLEALDYAVVFHVHDEVVIECTPDRADLDHVSTIMSQPLPWAPGLPLGADGWIGDFYKKD